MSPVVPTLVQAVSRDFLTPETRVQFQDSHCGICGVDGGTGPGPIFVCFSAFSL
jgi:hypothetical protein